MFKTVRFRNFRGFRDTKTLRLRRLNVLLGANNTGKSSLLYGLLMLKQTLQDKDTSQTLVTSGPFVELGSFLDLVHGRDPNSVVSCSFTMDAPIVPQLPTNVERQCVYSNISGASGCDVSFSFHRRKNAVEVAGVRLFRDDGTTVIEAGSNRSRPRVSPEADALSSHMKAGYYHFLPSFLPRGPRPKDEKVANMVMSICTSTQMLAAMLAMSFDRLRYVAPVRERIPPYGMLGTMPATEFAPTGQNLMRVLASRSRDGTRGGRALFEELRYWLEKRFRLIHRVRLVNIDKPGSVQALFGRVKREGPDINLFAMGCGISQLVPVVVQTILTPKNGCLLVEQPEVHLHPKAQADLADLFVEKAKRKHGQYIVETHSEHFLLRIRRRVAEGKLKPKDVRVLFCNTSAKGTTVRAADIATDGQLTRWPKDFFAEGYREAVAMAEAACRRGKR